MFKVLISCFLGFSLLAVTVYGSFVGRVHHFEDLSCSNENPCQNGGSCIDISEPTSNWTTIRCECPQGFVGRDCEMPICSAQYNETCFNGGHCNIFVVDHIDNYCSCRNNFSGERCQYWILITNFDNYMNMSLATNLSIAQGGGAINKEKYAQVGPTETLHMMNKYLGADGREFCLSFSYWLSGPDPSIEIYTTRSRLTNWSTRPEYIIQKRVLWASYKQPFMRDIWTPHRATFFGMNGGLFNIVVKVGESGFAGIDEIRGEYGPCK
ncbi:neurogenic locus notch homolog protein 1-like [Saccostrea cucullata]|uniref:neurogenic locus notch homolog protein 1-like n=1 Tax=Saccostrea cuccullata TaxID=36930 RepID=UPI002ED052C2